jgi:transposase-like protein
VRRPRYTFDGKDCTQKELRAALRGDYVTSSEARQAGISLSTLRKWRDSGRLRAKQTKSRWCYLRQDLIQLLKEPGTQEH